MKTVFTKDGIFTSVKHPNNSLELSTAGRTTIFDQNWRGAPPPNYGPGPIVLAAGDLSHGYFGEVTADELFYGNELDSLLGITFSVSRNLDAGWLKFAFNGKILFIAKKSFASHVSWDQIYSNGLVYGTDDNGLFPTGVPVNQLRLVSKNDDQFIVRLIKGSDTDPNLSSQGNDSVGTHNSEWSKLMYMVSLTVPPSQIGPNWENFTDEELGMAGAGSGDYGKVTWCQETSSVDSTARVGRGGSNGIDYIYIQLPSNQATFPYGWRPVLELVV